MIMSDRLPAQPSLPLGIEPRSRPEFWYDKAGWDDRVIEATVQRLVDNGFPIPKWNWPTPGPYNGVSGRDRIIGWQKVQVAMRNGLIDRPRMCSICGSTKNVGSHNEIYFRPLNARPVCSRCHRLIHRRFYDPNPWLQIAHEFAYEGAWFRNITLRELTTEQARYLASLDDPMDARQLGARVA